MKNLAKVIMLAASLTMGAQSINAKEYYVSANIGMGKARSNVQQTGTNVTPLPSVVTTSIPATNRTSRENMFTGGLAVGAFITEQFRTELALDYSQHKVRGPADTDSKKSHTNLRVMLNAYFDIGQYNTVTPYLMGGIGFGKNHLHLKGEPGHGRKLFKSRGTFAWQLGAGVDVPVGEGVKLGLGYRFIMMDTKRHKASYSYVDGTNTTCNRNVSYKTKGAHVALLSLRSEF